MTSRRKFLAGVGSLAAGSAAAVGTGAFSSQSSGDASLDIVAPEDAYVEVDPNTTSEFIEDGDPITIDLSTDANGGSGLSEQSNFVIQPAFTLTNGTNNPYYVEIRNPLANTDITTGASGGSGFGSSAVKGVDVQFLATDSGPIRNSREVGLIGRNTLPSSSLGGDFDEPGTNEYFPNQGPAESLGAGSRVQLSSPSNGSDVKAGALKIPSGQSFDVTYHVAVESPGENTSLDADFVIEAVTDKSQLTFDDTVNEVFDSGRLVNQT